MKVKSRRIRNEYEKEFKELSVCRVAGLSQQLGVCWLALA